MDNINSGSGGIIYFNPKGKHSLPEYGGRSVFRPYISLGHEIFHAVDANNGILGSLKTFLNPEMKRAEWQATFNENRLRLEMGLPLRTHYIIDEKTGKGTGPYMIYNSKTPKKPYWYSPF